MKKLIALLTLGIMLVFSSPAPVSAHTVFAGHATFGCVPAQYVASRNAAVSGSGVAFAGTQAWTAGLYCEPMSYAGEALTAAAVRHQVWVWPGWWYDCDFDYNSGYGASYADASIISNPICASENVTHRVLVSHSIWIYGQEFVNAYELYH